MFSQDKITEIEFEPGEFILREGANCDSLIIVKSGQIEVFRVTKDNKRVPLGIVQSGEYLGEMSLITDRPHSANAVALTRTKCLKISNDAVEDHLKSLPSWLVALTRGLVFKLYKTNEVLRRNGIVDESITTAVKAISEKEMLKDDPKKVG